MKNWLPLLLCLIPQLCAAELFLGVSLGDSCGDTYEMEVARGAEPGLPLEEMIRQGMMGFERSGTQTREISVYRCQEDTVISLSRSIAFPTEKAQKRYFQAQRRSMENRFGEPELDTFNLSLWKKAQLWIEGMLQTAESFKTVYWKLGDGETAHLSLTERSNQDKKYVVSKGWSGPGPMGHNPVPDAPPATDTLD